MAMGKLFVAIFIVLVGMGGGEWGVGAQTTHHVVGDDRGWDPNSDLSSWSHSRHFHVGDKIWFTYSAAQESIVELKSKEEYESCDVSNPIRMLTDGLDVIPLEEEGIHYFASGRPDSCNNGLKLHVEVQSDQSTTATKPIHQNPVSWADAVADGPTTPSASARLNGLSLGLFVGLLLVSYFAL